MGYSKCRFVLAIFVVPSLGFVDIHLVGQCDVVIRVYGKFMYTAFWTHIGIQGLDINKVIGISNFQKLHKAFLEYVGEQIFTVRLGSSTTQKTHKLSAFQKTNKLKYHCFLTVAKIEVVLFMLILESKFMHIWLYLLN